MFLSVDPQIQQWLWAFGAFRNEPNPSSGAGSHVGNQSITSCSEISARGGLGLGLELELELRLGIGLGLEIGLWIGIWLGLGLGIG